MQVSMPFHNMKCVLTWAFECPRMHQFSKVHFGHENEPFSLKIFMNNEYKHEQNGSPRSKF